MREIRFLQVDVFTDCPFGGNPLAVFPDAQGLTDAEMQSLAREMNLSETTFVLPPTTPGADFKVRIFTPAAELPFAGHPVVGTHWVLARLGRVALHEPVTQVRFELGVGLLPADLYVHDGQVQRVVMTQAQPAFRDTLTDLSELAVGLNLPVEAIAATGLPVQVAWTGIPALMVPVRSLAEVQGLSFSRLNTTALDRVCRQLHTEDVMVFTLQTERSESSVHARNFAPLLGVPEDPATGSASGAMGAYLVHYRAVPISGRTVRIISEQGSEIGRPSQIFIEVDRQGSEISSVRVGGQVVPLIEGAVRF